MGRPTNITIDATALLHNLECVKRAAPHKKIIAMVKADAYGCGLSSILPNLEGRVDAFGVASVDEALALRRLGSRSEVVIFQGVFSEEEWPLVAREHFSTVIHQKEQLQWLLQVPQKTKLKLWVKVDTGMHRLGFDPTEVMAVLDALMACPWVDDDIGLMTHLASADEWHHPFNQHQLEMFNQVPWPTSMSRSVANSAAILRSLGLEANVVRPGIMLYGVSPFSDQTGAALGLMPVMTLTSRITAIHHYPPHAPVGYGGTWQSNQPSIIGVVAAGYGDGYPRHVMSGTPTSIHGAIAPLVGRVSMDMLTVDLTALPQVKVGDGVELWGKTIPIECVAQSAKTIAYELMSQVTARPKNRLQ